MKYRIIMLFMLATIVAMAGTEKPEGDQWQHNIKEATAQASKENKAILLYFSGSDWCKPCIMLKREVMSTKAFQAYAKGHLVLVELDFPRLKKNRLAAEQTKHNEALAEKYNKEGAFPSVVFIDANGKVLAKSGYRSGGAEKFIKYLEEVLP